MPTAHLLLQLTSTQAANLIEACVFFAEQCEKEGDPLNQANDLDNIADHLREIYDLASEATDQQMRAKGILRYRNRPQG